MTGNGGGIDLQLALKVAHQAADAARAITLSGFRSSGLGVERKADESPVTEYDRRAEDAVRAVLADAFPEHGIVGEERGTAKRESPYRWIVDPIDGTISFTLGVPLWGTIIALEREGEVVVAVEELPAIGERFDAVRRRGTRRNGVLVHGSQKQRLSEAVVALGDRLQFAQAGLEPAFHGIHQVARIARTYPDVFGQTLTFAGHVDANIDPRLSPWDMAAARLLALEAGVATAQRDSTIEGKYDFVMAAPGLLDELLAWLPAASDRPWTIARPTF